MTLKDLPIGKSATILSVGGEGALRQHFLDMGIIPKADITMVKYAPMGDPVAKGLCKGSKLPDRCPCRYPSCKRSVPACQYHWRSLYCK